MLLCFASAVTPAAAPTLKKAYTDKELIAILEGDGYCSVELTEERVISVKLDGMTFVLYVYDDDDLQLYFGVTGYDIDAETMKDWNRTRRLSRACLDEENDPILETDLLANAGYTEDQLLEWLKVFSWSAVEFRQFLVENDKSD
jgi:hypothetical protein